MMPTIGEGPGLESAARYCRCSVFGGVGRKGQGDGSRSYGANAASRT